MSRSMVSSVKNIDYSLVFSRMEKVVLKGDIPQKYRCILKEKDIWSNLTKEQALSWARWTEIAGDIDTSLEILEWINKRYPDFIPAWQEHWELLNTLNMREKAVRLRAEAVSKYNIPSSVFPVFVQEEEQETRVEEPFLRYEKEQKLLELFRDVFKGREDCFARQWVDKEKKKQGYVPVRRSISLRDIHDHLMGYKTYGIYLLHSDSSVSVAVLDVDIKSKYRVSRLSSEQKAAILREKNYLLHRIPEISMEMGIVPIGEFSGGKGYHFWYFFEENQPAELARKLLFNISKKIDPDLSCFDLEIFPKQDHLKGNGLGNLVKLPLGIHRLTGKHSYFLNHKNSSVWEQISLLRHIKFISQEILEKNLVSTNNSKTIVHPRYKKWADTYPELAILKEKCVPLAQIFNSCMTSKELSLREEKVLFGTIGFMSRKKLLLHYLLGHLPEYNPHLVDYKLSRLRGTPLGCKKIHDLLSLNIDFCIFENVSGYNHPLLHCPEYTNHSEPIQEKVENLNQALEQLRVCLEQVARFLPPVDK